MKLHVDVERANKGFIALYAKNLKNVAQALENELHSNISTSGKGVFEKVTPEVMVFVTRYAEGVRIGIKGNNAFIAYNYGTGSLMETVNNPGLAKYKASKAWNVLRHSNEIVGRKAGEYTNFFTGKTVKTSGSMAGQSLEYRTISKKTKYKISPITPTNQLYYAIKWFFNDYAKSCYKKTLEQFNLSQYITYV